MTKYIPLDTLLTEIKRLDSLYHTSKDLSGDLFIQGLFCFLDTTEVKEVDISSVSENLAEAYQYLGYTHTGNLAHNKPMVSARLKRAIQGLFDGGLFKLTHDEKYRMERIGLKAQKGE